MQKTNIQAILRFILRGLRKEAVIIHHENNIFSISTPG